MIGKKTNLKSISTIIALLYSAWLLISCNNKDTEYKAIENMALTHEDGYVGDKSCAECHKGSYDTWRGSHHDLAMQVANDKTVLGNFNNQHITLDGVSYDFTKKENEFWVHIKEIDGSEKDYKISFTFGVTPLQQYLIDFEKGRKQVLRVTWDSLKNKWFHQYTGDKIDPHDWMHWTESSQNWNTMCAECHSTNLKKNYNVEDDSFHTTYSVINVSCESCHGPGERHISWAKKIHKEGETDMKTFILKGNNQLSQMNMCAPCHSRRSRIVENAVPNETYENQYIVENLTTNFYFADGQIKEEDYEYGSFLQSKMYHNNVKCTDCHNPHSLKLKKQGNDLCLQCHKPSYDSPAHHSHQPNTESSLCVNCHMTGKYYMGNDFRRDHSFRIPRPDQSVVYNTPNACTGCHKDKSNQWAADFIVKKYGKNRQKHFSDFLLLSNKAYVSAEERKQLLSFINDQSFPAIARSTVIRNLNASNDDYSFIIKSLDDPSSIVRFRATEKFQNTANEGRIKIASNGIGDSMRSVRIAALQLLRGIDKSELSSINQIQLSNASDEFLQMLLANADFSTGRVQLADYYLQNNQADNAIKQYNKALKMDKLLFNIYPNLATSYNLQGKNTEALSTLNDWIKLQPKSGQAYYLRALLLFEMKQSDKAIIDLKKALEYDSGNTRISYNLATYYYQNRDFNKAETYIKKALQIEPNNAEYNNLKMLINKGRGQ